MKNLLLFFVCCIFIGSAVSVASAQTSESASRNAEYAANAKQRKEMMRDYGLTEKQAEKIQQFSWERSLQIAEINKLNLSKQEIRAKRNTVTDEYYAKIADILTPEQRAKFNPAALKAAKADEIKHLKLSREQAYQMAELKAAYDARVAAMNDQKLPGRERKSQKETLDKEYRAKLKTLLGEEKFAKWLNFKNTSLERKYKTKYGFTEDQFNKYKAIENKKAIDMLVINKSVLSAAEKAAKIKAVKDAKVESMRTLLSADQFEKWYKDYLWAERKHQRKKISI